MIWILEQDIFEENMGRLTDEIVYQGHKSVILSDTSLSVLQNNKFCDQIPSQLDEPNIFYGSLQMADMVLHHTNWQVFRNLNNYKCSVYYPKLFKYLLNARRCAFLPFKLLKVQKNWVLETFGSNNSKGERCVFVRPNDGAKSFTGQVVWEDSWDRDIQLMSYYDVPDDHMCVAASPIKINKEYRFVVCGDRVITGSLYKEKDTLVSECIDAKHEAFKFAQDVINETKWEPDPVWTLDVCDSEIAGIPFLSVLEIGSFSCAGLYGCNMTDVVREVTKVCEKEYAEIAT